MDWGLYHSIATVGAFIGFIGVCWWAYTPKNKERFKKDANLVFDEPVNPAQSDTPQAESDTDKQTTGDHRS